MGDIIKDPPLESDPYPELSITKFGYAQLSSGKDVYLSCDETCTSSFARIACDFKKVSQ
jgi:CRISPR/Cas system-associated exonuclease Cas4 (RecB family)